jgi:hypothetical protein
MRFHLKGRRLDVNQPQRKTGTDLAHSAVGVVASKQCSQRLLAARSVPTNLHSVYPLSTGTVVCLDCTAENWPSILFRAVRPTHAPKFCHSSM